MRMACRFFFYGLFVLPWVVLIIFGSLAQQSQEILETVQGG